MTPSTPQALGLSIGTTTLAAVTADRAVTGRPAINRAGWLLDDFGDPVGIVAPDGSVHTGAALLAEALHEVARSATAGCPLPESVAVAYPAHWRPVAVHALGRALRRIPAWSSGVVLVPDHAAALTALRENPGIPERGVIAVCDFGASVSTLTLVDASDGILGEPVRYPDFSGDLIDRALLSHVLTAAGATPGATGTSAIKALTRLRTECREAKERLSTLTATTVPGVRGDIRVTRPELDEIVREPLVGVVDAVQDALRRNGISPSDLVAVASVGGMAAVPAVTTTLSDMLRVPVVTARRPALAAATGAALRAARPAGQTSATVITPAHNQPESSAPALAWSHAPDVPDFVPQLSSRPAESADPRPRVDFVPQDAPPGDERQPWYRKPLVVAAAVLAVVAGAGGATAVALRADTAASPARPSVITTEPPAPVSPVADGPTAPRTVVAVPAPATDVAQSIPPTESVPAAPVPEVPAPAVVAEPAPNPQPSPPATESAPVMETAPVAEAATQVPAAPQTPVIPTIPPLPAIPPIPIPIPSIPGLPSLFPMPPA
jgi:actin-like ATPase involved in cell morphogenesis